MGRYRHCALVSVLALLGLAGPGLADPFPRQYDHAIKAAWEQYHPGDDWRWFKAQLWQESLLNPNARSHVGAEGLAQFMPGTWAEITAAMRLGAVDRRMAEPSILAGAFYMRRLVYYYRRPRTPGSRRCYAQAAYNAGPGGVDRAQARCGGSREYPPIAPCLPDETRTYVTRIRQHYGRML